MRISTNWLQRPIAGSLIVLLAVPLLGQTQQPPPSQQQGASAVGQEQPLTANQAADQPAAKTNQSTPEVSTSVKPPANTATQEAPQTAPEPVGTAVAPYEKTVGVASSRPAGAVIAPAKQRRAHSLLIKVGLIVGGAAAIGTVVALSKSSSSRPNRVMAASHRNDGGSIPWLLVIRTDVPEW